MTEPPARQMIQRNGTSLGHRMRPKIQVLPGLAIRATVVLLRLLLFCSSLSCSSCVLDTQSGGHTTYQLLTILCEDKYCQIGQIVHHVRHPSSVLPCRLILHLDRDTNERKIILLEGDRSISVVRDRGVGLVTETRHIQQMLWDNERFYVLLCKTVHYEHPEEMATDVLSCTIETFWIRDGSKIDSAVVWRGSGNEQIPTHVLNLRITLAENRQGIVLEGKTLLFDGKRPLAVQDVSRVDQPRP